MLNPGDIDASIEEVFDSMEMNVEYEVTPNAFKMINEWRKRCSYNLIKPFSFKKTSKNSMEFDWKANKWQKTVVEFDGTFAPFAFALAFAHFSFALAFAFAFAGAFVENQIQKIANPSCNGKVVEIDGKKYKLTEI